MAKYRKKPVVIEAIQWTGENEDEVRAFLGSDLQFISYAKELMIRTLEGDMRAPLKHFFIRGVRGEHYSCKPDIFAETYELVEEPAS